MQRELSPFRDHGRTVQDPLQKDSTVSTHLHLAGGEIYIGAETSLSGTVGSSPLGVGTNRGARSGSRREGSRKTGMGGRGSGTRLKEARSSAADFSESEEDGMERRCVEAVEPPVTLTLCSSVLKRLGPVLRGKDCPNQTSNLNNQN